MTILLLNEILVKIFFFMARHHSHTHSEHNSAHLLSSLSIWLILFSYQRQILNRKISAFRRLPERGSQLPEENGRRTSCRSYEWKALNIRAWVHTCLQSLIMQSSIPIWGNKSNQSRGNMREWKRWKPRKCYRMKITIILLKWKWRLYNVNPSKVSQLIFSIISFVFFFFFIFISILFLFLSSSHIRQIYEWHCYYYYLL